MFTLGAKEKAWSLLKRREEDWRVIGMGSLESSSREIEEMTD